MESAIKKLYQAKKTIYTTHDLALLWNERDENNLKAKIAYYVKKKDLHRITRGVFAKDATYEVKELATSLYTPSYVSFETVLREAGIIFQHYNEIFVAAPYSMQKTYDEHRLTFRKLKDTVLFANAGIINKDSYAIASPERAFLDTLYLYPKFYFDNLDALDWQRCAELVTLYDNAQLEKRLHNYRTTYAT